jgi:hypothetical protein
MEITNGFSFLTKTFDFTFKNITISPTYWQALTIIILLFLLTFSLARIRYLYVHWSLGKSAVSMLIWGFLLAVILEGFLIVSGKSLLIAVFGWDDAPKPIGPALDVGREKLIDVLGSSQATESAKLLFEETKKLDDKEIEEFRKLFCE